MFESLRKNIQLVQEGITAGLNRLSSGAPTPTTTPDGGIPGPLVGGSAELLMMYQSHWATMHHIAVQNASIAEKVASTINTITEEVENQHSHVMEIRSLLAHLPNIMSQLHASLSTIGIIRNSLEEVESGLAALFDTIEEVEAQEQVLDLRMQVTLHREKRQHQLNMLHNELSAQYRARVEEHEKKFEKERRMRQQLYDKQFSDDLMQYCLTGSLKSSTADVPSSSIRLEDIKLDADPSELEDFLSSGGSKEAVTLCCAAADTRNANHVSAVAASDQENNDTLLQSAGCLKFSSEPPS